SLADLVAEKNSSASDINQSVFPLQAPKLTDTINSDKAEDFVDFIFATPFNDWILRFGCVIYSVEAFEDVVASVSIGALVDDTDAVAISFDSITVLSAELSEDVTAGVIVAVPVDLAVKVSAEELVGESVSILFDLSVESLVSSALVVE
ncbi:hypothetical protein AYI70_g5501, partial [Smittium culicis]